MDLGSLTSRARSQSQAAGAARLARVPHDARRGLTRLWWSLAPFLPLLPLLGGACTPTTFDATLADTAAQIKLEGSLTRNSSDGEGNVDLQLGGGSRQTSDGWLCPVYGGELRMFMNDAEMKVSSRGGYSAGQAPLLKSAGWPAGCEPLEGYVNFQGALHSDPSSPPEPPPDAASVTFRIVDRSGTYAFDVAAPTATRSLSLTAPLGRPIVVGGPVTMQWEPATDMVGGLDLLYCTLGPPMGGATHTCLTASGPTFAESAQIDPSTVVGASLLPSGVYQYPSATFTFPMPSVPAGDGEFQLFSGGAAPGLTGCPFGLGCSFDIYAGDIVPPSQTIPASVGP